MTLAVVGVAYIAIVPSKDIESAIVSPVAVARRRTPAPLLVLASTLAVGGASVWILLASNNVGSRPVTVFFALAIMPGIIYVEEVAGWPTIQLAVQLVMYVIVLLLSSIIVFPYDGGDTWVHLHNALLIQSTGTIRSLTDSYRDYPLYPALLAQLSTLTRLSVELVARLVGVGAGVACLLLLFSATRVLAGRRVSWGLALLLASSKLFVYWFSRVIAMPTTTLLLVTLLVIVLLLPNDLHPLVPSIVAVLTGLIAPFFHPVVAAAAVLCMFLFQIARSACRPSKGGTSYGSFTTLGILLAVTTLAQWIFFGKFIFDRSARLLVAAILQEGEQPVALAHAQRSLGVTLFDETNFYVFLALALFAGLWALRDRRPTWLLLVGFSGGAFVAFGYAANLIQLKPVAPERWFLLATLLLVVPAAVSFTVLSKTARRPLSYALLAVLLSGFAFLGVANNEANQDRPFFGQSLSYRDSLTDSEFAGLTYLARQLEQHDSAIQSDSWLWYYWQYLPGSNGSKYWSRMRLDDVTGFVSKRDGYDKGYSFGYSDTQGYSQALSPDDHYISTVYDSGQLQWLYRERR